MLLWPFCTSLPSARTILALTRVTCSPHPHLHQGTGRTRLDYSLYTNVASSWEGRDVCWLSLFIDCMGTASLTMYSSVYALLPVDFKPFIWSRASVLLPEVTCLMCWYQHMGTCQYRPQTPQKVLSWACHNGNGDKTNSTFHWWQCALCPAMSGFHAYLQLSPCKELLYQNGY